jgi:hypothetical protein
MVSFPPKNEPVARAAVRPPSTRPMSGSAGGGVNDVLSAPRIIAPTILLPAEIIIFELKPSLWYVVFVSLPVAAVGLFVLFLSFALTQVPEYWRQWSAVIGIWIVGLRVVVGLLQWLGRTYVLTDRRVLMQSGVVDVQVQSLNLEDIEAAFVAKAWAQRVLSIGTLFFRTKSPPCLSLAWEHIKQPEEVRGRVLLQIDRWKRSLEMAKPK